MGLGLSVRETFRREAVDGRVLCDIGDEDLSGETTERFQEGNLKETCM